MKTTLNWIQQADIALKRAALRAREVAERTNTLVHVINDGKMVALNRDLVLSSAHESLTAPQSRSSGGEN
jgi:hypothetical protein